MPVQYLKETPSQTAGPYVHIGTMPVLAGLPARSNEAPHVIVGEGVPLVVEGYVHDGAGAVVRDAMLELWQADAKGRYNHGEFRGWARSATDFQTGLWRFETIRPGPTPAADGRMQAPHLTILIFARGINIHLHTRIYFPEDEAAHASDPAMQRVEQAERRKSLVASKAGEGLYRFDVRLQGPGETVFFDI